MQTHPAVPPVQLFSVDLNGTLLGNREATDRFTRTWEGLPAATRPALVYTCGRSLAEMELVVREHALPAPTAMIGELGTSVKLAGRDAEAEAFNERFQGGWSFARVDELIGRFTGLWRNPPGFLFPYRSEWVWRNAGPSELQRLQSRLAEEGIDGKVIYTENRYLEVVPADTDKGTALAHLCSVMAIPLEAVLVAGDTLHDASMLLLPKVRRIVLENALPDLLAELVGIEKYLSPRLMADGVLDGLRYFHVLAGPGQR